MSRQPDAPPDNRPLGGFLVLVGAIAMVASRLQSTRSQISAHDPGPWFLPLGLAAILVIGGAGIFWRSRNPASAVPRHSASSAHPSVWFLIGLAAYLAALPWLGFLAGTTLFLTAMLWALKVVWWRALLAGLVLTGTAFAIFGWGFNVQLPAGFGN